MNKIFKVIYSKTRHCYVVVSELAKSHCKTTQSHTVRSKTALTAAVLLALGAFSFVGMPSVQAESLYSNDYVGTNYKDDNGKSYSSSETKNYHGGGARGVGSNTLGMNAIAGKNTITIGDRDASMATESVYIGSKYDANNQIHPSSGKSVVSVGYGSDAAGTGSIAIGSGASADTFDNAGTGTNPDSDSQSIAIGNNAVAKQNNIAIGANSMATGAASTEAAITGQAAPKSYVSVGDGKEGSDTRYRRISNVADGAADSDAATIAQLKQAVVATDASKKANIDASNIGENLKFKADGKTTADSSDKKTNEDDWGRAIGTGSIANSNTNGSGQLVTGTTVYNYVAPKAVDGKALRYISKDKPTGINLGILDDEVSTNATDITGLKSLSNITDNGKTVIKKAAVGAVKVTAGDRITVTPDSKNLTDADTVTYTISAKNDGKVASGNSDLVSGDTVYQALQNQTKSLTYTGGWGINIDSSKKISLKNNLTTVIYDGWSSSKDVKFNIDDTAMAIGGAIYNNIGWGEGYVAGKTMTIDSTGRYSVRLGGINNSTTGIYSTVTGGSANVASGYASSVNGGKNNTASGKYATVIGGGYLWAEEDFPDVDESIFGSHASSERNDASGILSTIIGGHGNKASGANSLIVGGLVNEASNESASIFGGGGNRAAGVRTTISGGEANFAVGVYSNVSGGIASTTEGRFSTISGGYGNIIADEGPVQPNKKYYDSASGVYGSAFGGGYNVVGGENGTAVGGGHSVVYGVRSVGLAGGSTGLGAHYALAAGYQSVVTTKGSKLLVSDKRNEFTDDYYYDYQGYAYKILGKEQYNKHIDFIPEYEDVATAVGYQATANEPDTISFGHDVGDVSGYDVKWKERTDKDKWGYINTNPDGTINDYAKKPDIIINHYDTAKYNRLVKVADGINNHDVVVMEQLRNADNVGKNAKNNVVVYKENEDGTLQVDENGEAIIDVDASKAATEKATEQAIKDSKDAWGKALGTGKIEADNGQLVTGKTVYDEVRPTQDGNYVKKTQTTGENLSALDSKIGKLDETKKYNYIDSGKDVSISDNLTKLDTQVKGNANAITNINQSISTLDQNAVKYDDSNKSKITLGGEGGTTITNVKSALDGAKDAEGKDATIATATGDALKNAANLGDLQKVYNDINTKAENASASHTALTVEGNTPAGKGKDEKTKEDVYAGKNILLHESTDKNGKVTYDLKLAKDISIGKPGKDGEDGKIGIDGKDGHIGLNGSDGITVRGLDGKDGAPGKDGVTITGPKGADGTDGKVGISGKDGEDAVSISGKNGVGHIGLTGPAGTNGKDGATIDITVKNGYDDAAKGINGTNGVDGKDGITRIVYTDKTGDHQVATMEDGMKYAGDDAQKDTTKVIAKKLNSTLDIIGGADSKNLTEGNIGVNSTKEGKLKVQLAKDLTDITSISNQKTEGGKTTGAKITLGTDGSVDVNGGKITNVGSGIEKDANGKYTVTKQNEDNAANIGDVRNIVKDAKDELISGDNGLNNKANVDASNIGSNITVAPIYQKDEKGQDVIGQNGQKVVDQKATEDAQKAARTDNENAWGEAIGTGKIEANNGQLVTGDTVYNEVRPKVDGSYVKKDKTTGENLSALDSKIGKLDETKKYNYIDSGKDVSISNNLTKLDTQVKNNADAIQKNSESIQNITNNVNNLSDNAVQYDKGSNKTKVTLAGKDGTTITNVKDGALSENSSDAVNGKQLYNEQEARKAADQAITEKVTNNTNEITKIKNGEGFTDTGKTIIKNLSKDAVQVKAGDRIKVDEATDEKTGNKTYTISANNNGKVAKDDGNLISGDTLYKEVHVDKDGSYIKGSQTVGQNLSALDSGLKTTSDLIHTNTKGDTIQIGGNSTAMKIDINGKDGKGRVITGVVSDANDPNSAANVGYVNGLTAANTQQIYRDMNNAYSRLDTNINRAAAGSNALAALHPLDFDPADKASFAVGYGHYRNANAAAVGAFYQPNANTMVNMGISLGNGDPGFNAGVSFKIGKGSAYNGVSKAEMAQTIHDQATEISAIKADDAAKDKRIDALEKENQEMKKQIQEILARLNG